METSEPTMQMSLATAAKEGPGSDPQHSSRQHPFLCRQGVFSSRPQIRGIDWVQLCFSVWECLVGRHLGREWEEPPPNHSFQGADIVFQKDRHCPLLSLPADFVSIWRFVGVLFFFFLIVLKSGRNMKDFVLMGGLILAPRPAANWHSTSVPDRPSPRLSVQLLIM